MEPLETLRTPISLVVAVPVRLYREGLATTLSSHAHLRIVGTVETLSEAQHAVRALEPDVLIVDASLNDPDCGMMRAIRAESSRCRILAFAVREDIAAIVGYAEAGADGFVTANGAMADLVEAIERTAAGELLCSPRIAAELLRRAACPRPLWEHSSGSVLTGRQRQVFALLKQGLSNKEIATALGISEATVKNHVHYVLQKLQVTSRGQAVASTDSLVRADFRRHARQIG